LFSFAFFRISLLKGIEFAFLLLRAAFFLLLLLAFGLPLREFLKFDDLELDI